jgi:two-component system KDP operon response regulator KdpE
MNKPSNVVLLIDDEPKIRRFLRAGFELHGFSVIEAESAADGLKAATFNAPDLIVLDLALPDLHGTEVLDRLRSWSNVPVIILSVVSDEDEKVRLLQAGADDYVVKPFALAELLARLRALLRRRFEGEGGLLRVGDLTLNLSTREGSRGERDFTLTRIEFDLLEMFLRHPRQVLTREVLLNRVWGFDFDSGTNSLAVYVGYLRRKLEEGGEPRCIQTVRGVGYVLRDT